MLTAAHSRMRMPALKADKLYSSKKKVQVFHAEGGLSVLVG